MGNIYRKTIDKFLLLLFKHSNMPYLGGVLSIIAITAIASVLFLTGPLPLKNISSFNSSLLLKSSRLNESLRLIKSETDNIVYYNSLRKPSEALKIQFKKVLNGLKADIAKTDIRYKNLNSFIEKNGSLAKKDGKIINYFNKSYFQWKNISKPILNVILKYHRYAASRISLRLFLKHAFYLSYMPTSNIIKEEKSGFRDIIGMAILYFIISALFIIFLTGLFFCLIGRLYKYSLENERRFKSLFYSLPLVSFIVEVETGNFIDANDYAVNFYGYSKEELLSMSINTINVSVGSAELKKFRRSAVKKGHESVIFKHRLKNGDVRTVQTFITGILLNGKPHLNTIVIDITEKIATEKALKESEELFKTATENLLTGVVLYREKYIYANPMAEKILGYSKEELYGKNVWDIYPDERDKLSIKQSIAKRLAGETFNVIYTLKILKKQNEEAWLLISSSTVKYGGRYAALSSFIDNTEQVLKEHTILKEKEEYRTLSEYDQLTGIFNRRAYENRIMDALSAAGRYKRPLSLIMFDIDDFKKVNDELGHAAGDSVLKEVAAAVKEDLRTTDILARVGGEEFMIIVPEATLETAVNIAERFRSKIENRSFAIGSRITLSFGVTAYDKGMTKENMEYFVDLALYKAKQEGKNRVEVVSN